MSPLAGTTGGLAGVCGGMVIVISGSVSGGAISGQTITAGGGAHGTSNGAGTGITNGSPGTVILIPN